VKLSYAAGDRLEAPVVVTGDGDEIVLGALRALPVFGGVDEALLAKLAMRSVAIAVTAGSTVFAEGDVADGFYVVDTGRLEAIRETTQTVIRHFRTGDSFGEIALLGDDVRSATVRAVRDSVLWQVSTAAFDELLGSSASFAAAVARSLATQLRVGVAASRQEPPRVVAIVSLHDGSPVTEVADAIAREKPGAIAVCECKAGTRAEWAARVDALERDHELVLLIAPEGASDDAVAFSGKEADRVLGVMSTRVERHRFAGLTDVVVYNTAVPSMRFETDTLAMHVVRPTEHDAALARLARTLTGRAVGLALSGGGARGFAHVGVLHVLEDEGIVIDRFAGTSMGALVGALAARGLGVDTIEALLRDELVARHPFRDYRMSRVSLIRAERARAMLERLFSDQRIEQLPRAFCCVTADLGRAERLLHRHGRLVEAIGASISLPGVAPPRRDGDRLLVDGGVLDNLPVDVLAESGEGPVIAVDVMARGLPRSAQRGSDALPSMIETLGRAMTLASRRTVDDQRARADVVIDPDVGDIGLLEFAGIDRAIAAGRRAAWAAIESLRRYAPD
jgi:predicted acylesterase/phospholipase RssA